MRFLLLSLPAGAQEVPHGDFESLGNLTGWAVVFGSASDVSEIDSTIRSSRVMQVDRGGASLVVCSTPFVVTRVSVGAVMRALFVNSNDETDWWIEPGAGGTALVSDRVQPDDSQSDPYSAHALGVQTLCSQSVRVCVSPRGNETILYDDFELQGAPCPVFEDNDEDGYCTEGIDLDRDGTCAGVGEFDAPFVDCDDENPDRSPGEPEVCNGLDDDCDDLVDEDFDRDGDGFSSCDEVDCDDDRANVNPDASERCNGRDDNCDGKIDEGFDVDRDGYTTCDGDCDDTNVNVHPDAVEQCNDRDDDCDDDIDEDVSWVSWYPDRDGDGYGDPTAPPVYDCVAPDGSVDNALDCDDADDALFPGSDVGTGDCIPPTGVQTAVQLGCGCAGHSAGPIPGPIHWGWPLCLGAFGFLRRVSRSG